jgi:hypothetical protein
MSLPALKSGGAIAPIIPTTFEDVQRVAKIIHASGLAPRDLGTAEKVATVILLGMEIGLPPMFSMQNIAVINGRPTIWGKAIPALLHRAGFKIEETADENGARCKITRPGGQEFVRTFTRKDAIDAGLWNKAGPWKQYPVRMMQMRARGFCAADAAADVLGGLYLSEELQGGELRDADEPPQIAPSDEPELPPDDEPEMPPDEREELTVDPHRFVEDYRDTITLMPPDERQEFCESNADAIASLPPELQEEIDAINRELMP